jgi:hypothetical protein
MLTGFVRLYWQQANYPKLVFCANENSRGRRGLVRNTTADPTPNCDITAPPTSIRILIGMLNTDVYHSVIEYNLTCFEHTLWMTSYDNAREDRFTNMLFGLLLGAIIYNICWGCFSFVSKVIAEPEPKSLTWKTFAQRLDLQASLISVLYLLTCSILVVGHLCHQACITPYLAYYMPQFTMFYFIMASLYTACQNIMMVTKNVINHINRITI